MSPLEQVHLLTVDPRSGAVRRQWRLAAVYTYGPSLTDRRDYLGSALAAFGDLNGDGHLELV